MRKIYYSRVYLVLEFMFFYVFLPFIATYYLEGWFKVLPLFGIGIFFLIMLLQDPTFDRSVLTRFDASYLKGSITRMILITILLSWFTWWIYPQLFFMYPLRNIEGYLITFFLYPLASVLPQEIIYRVYYFHRYRKLVPETSLLMLSNAIIFGLTHFIYANWVAPIATFLAAWLFIYTFFRTKNLLNVSLEHYFYGLIMFTIGFGHFFQ